MLANDIRINQQAFFSSTIPLKISEAQIKKHIRDRRVRQLKDLRCSLYLRFNSARTGGTWWFYRYQDGKQHPYRIATYPATQAKDIMEVVSAVSVQVARGEELECNLFETVEQLVDWHVQRQLKLNRSSKARLHNLRSMADKHISSMLHGWPVSMLDYQALDKELIQPMFELGYSVSYVRANFNLVKTAFSAAKKLKHITRDPIADVQFKHFFADTFSVSRAQVRGCRLNTDQLPGLLAVVEKQDPPRRLLITMILAHGTRIGETRKALWKNVSLTQKRWTVPKEDAKNGQSVVYPLTDEIVELLQSYRDWQDKLGYQSDCVFPVSKRGSKPIYAALASEWVREVANKTWSAHDLRKRARSVWLELGIDYIVCEALLNHARDKLDQVYIHTHMELQKKQAMETYHDWLKSCWRSCFTPVSMKSKILDQRPSDLALHKIPR